MYLVYLVYHIIKQHCEERDYKLSKHQHLDLLNTYTTHFSRLFPPFFWVDCASAARKSAGGGAHGGANGLAKEPAALQRGESQAKPGPRGTAAGDGLFVVMNHSLVVASGFL